MLPRRMSLPKLVNRLMLTAVFATSLALGAEVPPKHQIEIFKTLITIASVIFAVMGAWLSLIKSDIYHGIKTAQSFEDGSAYVKKARNLVKPMSASAIIIFLSCIYMFSYFALNELNFAKTGNPFFVNSLTFSICATLSYYQLSSIFSALSSGANYLIEVSQLNQELRSEEMRKPTSPENN